MTSKSLEKIAVPPGDLALTRTQYLTSDLECSEDTFWNIGQWHCKVGGVAYYWGLPESHVVASSLDISRSRDALAQSLMSQSAFQLPNLDCSASSNSPMCPQQLAKDSSMTLQSWQIPTRRHREFSIRIFCIIVFGIMLTEKQGRPRTEFDIAWGGLSQIVRCLSIIRVLISKAPNDAQVIWSRWRYFGALRALQQEHMHTPSALQRFVMKDWHVETPLCKWKAGRE